MLAPGSRLGPYEILAPLGAGGMGEVYRARDPRLGRHVAIKVLPESVAADPARLHRFEQEARAVAALSHPNILSIFDVGAGDRPYLVTELLDGETLRSMLDRGPLSLTHSTEIGRQLVSGLAAAHGCGFVHRDLKPDNIFVTRDGVVKILDFGLAKAVSPAHRSVGPAQAGHYVPQADPEDPDLSLTRASATMPGLVMGTVGYMAPEQVRGLAVDERTDIFAVGALLYEMVSGERAFRGDTPADTMSAVLNAQPPDLVLRTGTPLALARIVRRCLEKDPNERFQSARDVKFALESISDVQPSPPQPAKKPDEKSIAVLPFANMSTDPENEYFSDGLAEELINALSQLPGLRVVARTSAFQFRGRNADVREIGRQLNVDHVLEGSVRRSGKRLRVTAQLVAVADGYHLWSDRYDREMADVFDIQDDIAASIVKTIEPTLVGHEPPAARRHSENVAAFELYLKGRNLLNQRTPQSLRAATAYFEQAIALDADYALAHAGIADSYSALAIYGFVRLGEARTRAQAAAQQAMALDPALAESHFAMGISTMWLTGEWPEAGRHFAKALEIQPGLVIGQAYYSFYLASRHRHAEADERALEAIRLDSLSPFAHAAASVNGYIGGRHDEAVRMGERALELHPDFALALWTTCLSCCQLGKFDRAIELAERIVSLTKRAPVFVGLLGHAYAGAGRRNEAMALLEELEARRADEYVIPTADILISVALGDRDRTYEALVAGVDEGITGCAVEIWIAPYLHDLAGEPRFVDLFEKLRMVPRASHT